MLALLLACKVENGVGNQDNEIGKGWTRLRDGDVTAFAIGINGDYYAAQPRVGIFKSTNRGASWTKLDLGIASLDLSAFAASPHNFALLYFATNDSGLYRSYNAGQSFEKVRTGKFTTVAIGLNGNIFGGVHDSGIVVSHPGGNDWTSIGEDTRDIRTFCFTNANTNIIDAASTHFLWRTTDGGRNWKRANHDANSAFSQILTSAQTDQKNPSKIWIGVNESEVWKSADGGQSWEWAGKGFPGGSAHFSIMAFAQDGSNLYCGLDGVGGVYVSTDEGANWSLVEGSAGMVVARNGVAVDGAKIFVCTKAGLFVKEK